MLYLARAVKHLEITVTAPMTNITPAFILLFAFIFLKETPTLAQIGCIMLLIAGAYLLEIRPHKHSTFQPIVEMIRSKYMHYLLGAIIAFALLAVFEKHFVTNLVQPLTYIFFFWIFISMNFVFLHWYRYGLSEVRQEIGKGLKWYVIGGIFSVLASITYLIALSHTPVTLVIPLRRSTTLFTTLIGGRMFKESNNHMKIAACIIMILGVYLIIGT
ncbi:MAG: EamA family transporter, partial [Nanoarchaeota archaeon]|nr:EamA family transporter [Nanoarchaeota archaeon]